MRMHVHCTHAHARAHAHACVYAHRGSCQRLTHTHAVSHMHACIQCAHGCVHGAWYRLPSPQVQLACTCVHMYICTVHVYICTQVAAQPARATRIALYGLWRSVSQSATTPCRMRRGGARSGACACMRACSHVPPVHMYIRMMHVPSRVLLRHAGWGGAPLPRGHLLP